MSNEDFLLTTEELENCQPKTGIRYVSDRERAIAKAQIQHLLDLGYKSPEEVEQARADERAKIETAYDKYITLLGAELEELVPIASSHGWKSSRYDAGIECRKEIDNLKRG